MRHLLALISGAAGGIFSLAANAACSDGDWWSVAREYREAHLVFIGEVVAERPDPGDGHWIAGTFYRLKVNEVFRGTARGQIDLFSENSSGRFPMRRGVDYLVFASMCENRLFAYAKGNSETVAASTTNLNKVRQLSARTGK